MHYVSLYLIYNIPKVDKSGTVTLKVQGSENWLKNAFSNILYIFNILFMYHYSFENLLQNGLLKLIPQSLKPILKLSRHFIIQN